MSTEEQRRAARAARLGPVQGPPEQVPGQQPLELETPAQDVVEVVEDAAPPTGDDTPKVTESGDDDATVRHDGEDVPHDGDGEVEVPADGDRHVVDDGKAAGEAMRRERTQRGGKAAAPRHGHGWLDVEAFTDHLRTARLRPLGTGQGTVNVRVSAPLVEALEAYRGEVDVSKRDVVEALLVELLGPSAEGGRR